MPTFLEFFKKGEKSAAASYMLQATCYKLHATNYMLQATSYKLHATSYMLQATCYKLQATCYKLHATCYMLQATCYKLHATCYMLVSLTSVCCKIFEHIMFSNVTDHLESNDITVNYLHVFTNKHSCEIQLICRSTNITKMVDI